MDKICREMCRSIKTIIMQVIQNSFLQDETTYNTFLFQVKITPIKLCPY